MAEWDVFLKLPALNSIALRMLMAETLEETQNKRKTRVSSWDESSISNVSPESKKLKSDEHAVRVHEVSELDTEEDTCVSLPALNMTEEFSDTLQNILKKLDKLDSIEKSMKDFQATLLKLEGRVQNLESCHATTRRDVEDIKESLNSIEADHQEASQSLKKIQDDTNTKLKSLEEENLKLGARIKEVEDQHLYLEAYSRRENVKFENIPEDDASREDTELVLRSFLERDLGYVDAASVEIQRVHRLGKKKEGKQRPILARFLRFKDCQSMLALGPRLRETNFKMYQDLPFEIVERRRAQMDTFKKARRNNIPASFSKAQPDKLFVRGKFWPLGKELEL